MSLKRLENIVNGRVEREAQLVDEIYDTIKPDLNEFEQKYDALIKIKISDVLSGWSIRGRNPRNAIVRDEGDKQ